MDYELCSRLLNWKHCNDDVKELIFLYKQSCEKLQEAQSTILDRNTQITVLSCENTLLKENLE